MKQNKYDEPEFFDKYSKMRRSVGGLDDASEWHAFRALLPDLHNKRLLDLGCGFGWHCRYARQQQARSVVGVDLSEKMLARANATVDDPGIEYRNRNRQNKSGWVPRRKGIPGRVRLRFRNDCEEADLIRLNMDLAGKCAEHRRSRIVKSLSFLNHNRTRTRSFTLAGRQSGDR
jgi:SAM-dependent methyltransferase